MAIVLSRATGNWLTAGTWETIDATSYVNSESATGVVTTSYLESTAATTGVITATGIGIKLSVRTGTTGTITVRLAIAGVTVTGTEVAINVADLPVAATADVNGGWHFFEFAAPVLLLTATSYTVSVKTSSSSQVSLFASSGTLWSHFICTTASAAPTTGDDVIIAGEYTGAGTSNSFVVTMDALAGAITDYGAASTSHVTPSLSICNKSTLTYGTTAATAYYLRQSGCVVVYSGGTLNMGTTGTPIPRDSTAVLNFDCGANVDFGLVVRNLGTFNAQGLSRTSGKDIYTCKLNTDEAVNSTSLGVDIDTGWLDNDVIAVASTTRTATQCEQGTLNGAAGASSLTVDGFGGAGGGLAFAHSGTSPTQAEAILLTRNVQLFGASASLQAYIDIKATATVDVDWAEFKWLGSATTLKFGIDCGTTTGSTSIRFSSLHTFSVTGSRGFNASASSGSQWEFSDNVSFLVDSMTVNMSQTSSGTTWVVNNGVFMRNVSAAYMVSVDVGGTLTNTTCVGSASVAFVIGRGNTFLIGTFSGLVSHSGFLGFFLGAFFSGARRTTIGALTAWRHADNGLRVVGYMFNVTFTSITAFGNTGANFLIQQIMANVSIQAMMLSGDTSFSSSSGIQMSGTGNAIHDSLVDNATLGVVSGIFTAHTSADIDMAAATIGLVRFSFRNSVLASATELLNQTNLPTGCWIGSERHDGVAGAHKMWKREGTIAIETGTVHTGSQALSMTPNSSATTTTRLETQVFMCAVANAATITPSVYLNKSAAYDGAQPRLVLRANPAIGIAADVVLATYSAGTGSWNALSGTSAAVTDDGVLEFFVDCTYGTGGVVYVDTVTVT